MFPEVFLHAHSVGVCLFLEAHVEPSGSAPMHSSMFILRNKEVVDGFLNIVLAGTFVLVVEMNIESRPIGFEEAKGKIF